MSLHRPRVVVGFLLTACVATAAVDSRAEPADGAASVTRIRVLTESGNPIAGAEVRLMDEAEAVLWLAAAMDGEPAATTDAAGIAVWPGRISGRAVVLHVEHPEYARVLRSIETGADGAVPEIRLQAGSELRGVVVDESGAPVAGAVVALAPANPWQSSPDDTLAVFQGHHNLRAVLEYSWHSEPEERRGATDEDGRFRLRGLSAGTYRVIVLARGSALETDVVVALQAGQSSTGVRVPVELGATLRGVVVDVDRRPVVGALVQIATGSCAAAGSGAVTDSTDATGRFELGGLQLGAPCEVEFGAPGFVPGRRGGLDSSADGVELVLVRRGSVAGRARLETGEVARTVRIVLEPIDAAARRAAGYGGIPDDLATDGGAYLLEGVAPGRWRLTVSAPGFQPTVVDDVVVHPGRTTTGVDVQLHRGGQIAGQVVRAADGTPVRGAAIFVRRPGEGEPGREALGRADAHSDHVGRFLVTGVPFGRMNLAVTHPEFAATVIRDVAVAGRDDVAQVSVELSGGGVVEGWIRQAGGEPVAGAAVELLGTGQRLATRWTDADGHFRFELIAPGSYVVRRSSRVDRGLSVQTATADVRDGRTTRVDFEGAGPRVTGRVTRAGEPLAAAGLAWVRRDVHPADSVSVQVETDERGWYEVEVPPGDYVVAIRAAGRFDGSPHHTAAVIQTVVAVPDVSELTHDIELPDLAIAGRLVDAETGEPVVGATVHVRRGQSRGIGTDGAAVAPCDPDGRFRVPLAAAGRYRLTVAAPGYPETAAREVVAGPDGVVDYEIELRRGMGARPD